METALLEKYRETPEGQEAEEILRACVHCGFCTATCPTYQLLGDENDGPRGRIYLIKQLLEGKSTTDKTLLHLDRCLSCRACETTCPSGVKYARLAEIGRHYVQQEVGYPLADQIKRLAIRKLVPYPARFSALMKTASIVKPLLPVGLQRKVPQITASQVWAEGAYSRRYLVLEGCVQKAVTPSVNAAASQVLAKLGIGLVPVTEAGCCGAVSFHNGAQAEGLDQMRRNIDLWWPLLQQDFEGILINASGCGLMVKEYAVALKHDPEYCDKAQFVSERAKDISELLAGEDLEKLKIRGEGRCIAFHAPCTLQHGQRLDGVVEGILTRLGFSLTTVNDSHLCCGSAGAYSLLQPELSKQLRDNKLENLRAGEPELIATANIGCQMHLSSGQSLPVVHWIELLY